MISSEKVETLHLLRPLDYVSYLCDTVATARKNAEGKFELSCAARPGDRLLFVSGAQVWPAYAEHEPVCALVLRQGIQDPVLVSPKPGINAEVEIMRQHSKDLYARFEHAWDTMYYAMADLRRAYQQHPDTFLSAFADYHFTYNQIDAATHMGWYTRADTLESSLMGRRRLSYTHPECMQFMQQMALNRMMVDAMRHHCSKPEEVKALAFPLQGLACEMQYYPNGQVRELLMLLGLKLSLQHHFYEDEAAFREAALLLLERVRHPGHVAIAAHLKARYRL